MASPSERMCALTAADPKACFDSPVFENSNNTAPGHVTVVAASILIFTAGNFVALLLQLVGAAVEKHFRRMLGLEKRQRPILHAPTIILLAALQLALFLATIVPQAQENGFMGESSLETRALVGASECLLMQGAVANSLLGALGLLIAPWVVMKALED